MWIVSSIFNFETLRISLRPSGAVLLAFALCVTVRIVFGYAANAGLARPTSLAATIDAMREGEYREYATTNPQVLLMGTSRFIDVSEACVARELGLSRKSVVNFSHLGNTFWQNLKLLRRNPELARSAKVVYLDVSPYQLNSEDIAADQAFLRHATPRERLTLDHRVDRIKAIADMIFPIWSERRTVEEWLEAVTFVTLPSKMRADRLRADVDNVKRLLWTQIGSESKSEAIANNVSSTGPNTEFNRTALAEFVDALPTDCTIIFVHIPVHEKLREFMYDPPDRRAAWGAMRQHLEALAANAEERTIVVIWPEKPEDLGLGPAHYLGDGIHFGNLGNEVLCKSIAGHIRAFADVTE